MGLLGVFAAFKGLKLIVRLLVLLVLAVLVYLTMTASQVWLTSRRSDPLPSQAIVIMGAAQYDGVPSPDLLARTTEARTLYLDHLAPLIVATGYKEPGDIYTESHASAVWLVAHGVPSAAIIEVGGDDSWSNLSDAARVLSGRGLSHVLIVTDGFHEARSLAIAGEVGLRALPVPARGSPITGWATVPYFAKETFGVALGRLVGYSRLHSWGSRSGEVVTPLAMFGGAAIDGEQIG